MSSPSLSPVVQALPVAVICKSCGASSDPASEFCRVCLGELSLAPTPALAVQSAPPVAEAPPAPPEPPIVEAPLPTLEELGPTPGSFDLILRGQRHLTALMTSPAELPGLTQRLLGLSVMGLTVHGLVVGLGASFLARATSSSDDLLLRGMPMLWMPGSFVIAFLGALCVCLPSFYFYTQLSGLDASFRQVVVQALRAQATTSVLLLGALPFYAAWLLAAAARWVTAEGALSLGMFLPFLVGLAGLSALYKSFGDLARRLPITHLRRGNFLRRMVVCWGALYSVVAPLALYRVADALSRVF